MKQSYGAVQTQGSAGIRRVDLQLRLGSARTMAAEVPHELEIHQCTGKSSTPAQPEVSWLS